MAANVEHITEDRTIHFRVQMSNAYLGHNEM